MPRKERVIKITGREDLFKLIVERVLGSATKLFAGKVGAIDVELTGLRIAVGRVTLEFAGKTKLRIKMGR